MFLAEDLLLNCDEAWNAARLDQKQRLQAFLFPNGLVFDGKEFEPPLTSCAFRMLRGIGEAEKKVVPPRGIEPRFTD